MVSKGFSVDLKCCTYFPFVPNFSIGALIENGEAQQLEFLAIARRQGRTSPLGLFPSREFEQMKHALGVEAFGRKRELLCPFFNSESKSCSIWTYRPAVCASYFCQSSRANSWKNIEAYGNLFEWTLAHEVLWRAGFTTDETDQMKQRASWFEYADQEDTLYRKSYHLACEVSSGEILELMGRPMLNP